VSFNFEPFHFCNFVANTGDANVYVKNLSAYLANKMVMFAAVVIVMRGAVEVTDIQQLPRIRHLIKIPVNSSPAD
jgi:hypothetical protein